MPDITNLPPWAYLLAFLLIWVGREGIGAYLKWRAVRMDEVKADDQRALAGYLQLIGELRGRVVHLEATLTTIGDKHEQAIKTLREEHIACLESQAESKAKIAMLESEVTSLREWRHGIADQANTEVVRAEVQRKLAENAAQPIAKPKS